MFTKQQVKTVRSVRSCCFSCVRSVHLSAWLCCTFGRHKLTCLRTAFSSNRLAVGWTNHHLDCVSKQASKKVHFRRCRDDFYETKCGWFKEGWKSSIDMEENPSWPLCFLIGHVNRQFGSLDKMKSQSGTQQQASRETSQASNVCCPSSIVVQLQLQL